MCRHVGYHSDSTAPDGAHTVVFFLDLRSLDMPPIRNILQTMSILFPVLTPDCPQQRANVVRCEFLCHARISVLLSASVLDP